MIIRVAVAASLAVLLSAAEIAPPKYKDIGDWNRLWMLCAHENPDQRIAACPVLLKTGWLTRPQIVDAFLNLAEGYRANGMYDHAIANLNEAIRLRPTSDGYAFRALSYSAKGDDDNAMADSTKAIELGSKNTWVYIARGEIYRQRGRLEEALADFNRAVTMSPYLVEARGVRADVHRDMKNYDLAFTDYDAALDLDSDYNHAFANRCYLGARIDTDLDRALEDCSYAVRHRPDDETFLANRALVHLKRRDLAAALTDARAALAIDPAYERARLVQHIASAALGQPGQAAASTGNADDLVPGLPEEYRQYLPQ